ncbi:MAG TPA: GxxExxY protein [Candidatus Moranbacteria bacterium]|nr:GxxExxY protein [Candidatus Moranbacteria bacterium]HBY10857.1 GxxExxY protein [Candidatus Moranbacteria bacterium]
MSIRNDLIYKDECYKIIGLIFSIFNEIGYGHKESFYQKAIANIFSENNIEFKEQLKAKVKHGGKEIGYYIFDFLVFDKIVIELKSKNYFSKRDIDQLYSYLKAMNLKLGILVYFTKECVRYKRIVNLED